MNVQSINGFGFPFQRLLVREIVDRVLMTKKPLSIARRVKPGLGLHQSNSIESLRRRVDVVGAGGEWPGSDDLG
jgi:hypothetical protein